MFVGGFNDALPPNINQPCRLLRRKRVLSKKFAGIPVVLIAGVDPSSEHSAVDPAGIHGSANSPRPRHKAFR